MLGKSDFPNFVGTRCALLVELRSESGKGQGLQEKMSIYQWRKKWWAPAGSGESSVASGPPWLEGEETLTHVVRERTTCH